MGTRTNHLNPMKGGAGLPAHDPTDVWRRPERSPVGPKPEHSRNGIATAALRIADQEGLAAVSIRRVAASIGAGAASLYRYVKSHDELVELMMDAVAGEYQLEADGEHPRGRLLDLAHQGRDIMHRHPWLAPLLLTRPSMGPNSLRFLDAALAALAPVDLSGPAKLQIVAMMSAITSAFVQNELASLTSSGPDENASANRGQYIIDALQAGEYPHLAAAMAGHSATGDADEQFTSAITNYLTGAGIPIQLS
ncbi:TetR/AcrR family transcriptional regulator [Arthrobacter sp. ISL-95]|uniref:TetR/AcrR family transcriptional regulator n=1 Tax=Arthrobacter sp. ISL-95 TaxID=2819116 RepID=UPI001BE67050|nr:TetR/AcrR family transcriptional regulator C-terminal domain-containing protein [Arthrobacter sp. ISL-95]MBT2585318.1 TetR/AcrR family transcriptional regulator C-terminal domain-containing protein [Arthrobacter sp. ISL-95]